MKNLFPRLALGIAMGLTGLSAAYAAEPIERDNTNAVWFENWIGLKNATLKVAMPSGKIVDVYAESGTPVFKLDPADSADGVYGYELTAATDKLQPVVNPIDNGRGTAEKTQVAVGFAMTGAFLVSRGAIVPMNVEQEKSE